MLLQKTGLILGLTMSFFLAGCAGHKVTVKNPAPPTKVLSVQDCASEPTERDKKICLRAVQIAAQKGINQLEKGEDKESAEFRQARKEIDSEAKARANAGLSGCADPDSVGIDAAATGSWSYQAYGKMVCINTSGVPVNITDTFLGRVVVYNLGPGCSITLFKKIDFLRDSNQVSYQYVATGRFPDGNMGTALSPSMYLNQNYTGYQNGQNQIWTIQLQKYISQK